MSWRAGALVAVVAALATPVSAEAQGALLRVGLPSIPAVLDPATALDGTVPLITRQIFETLVQVDPATSRISPGLASSWQMTNDGGSWTFTLRDGVRFYGPAPRPMDEVKVGLAPDGSLFVDRSKIVARTDRQPV